MPAECDYEAHKKEHLAVISILEEWRDELMGLTKKFMIILDHKNLQFFMSSKKLSERQAR